MMALKRAVGLDCRVDGIDERVNGMGSEVTARQKNIQLHYNFI